MHRSTIHKTASSTATLALWIWFAVGAIAFACFPEVRGRNAFWGWLPFWFVVAPLLDLAVLHRGRLLVSSRAFLARRARHRRPVRQQAQRLTHRRTIRSARSGTRSLSASHSVDALVPESPV